MIKVVDSNSKNDENSFFIGTHSGIFHCDEIIAISILNLLLENRKNIYVIRSRDVDFLKERSNLLIDIGEGKFDHHQKNGNGKRNNGVEYASSGLVWKEFGSDLLRLLANNNLNEEEIETLHNAIDNEIIQNIDLEDNGQLISNHSFKYINDFLPLWYDDNADYNQNFEECVNITSKILKHTVTNYIAYKLAEKDIFKRINNSDTHIDNILLIPSQNIPWTNIIINYNDNTDDKVDFVVFPYPAGGYAIQCVPPSFEDKFGQRIPFPENWAGETENLKFISGIDSAILCHRGRFFARATELEDAIKMGLDAKIKNMNKDKIRIR